MKITTQFVLEILPASLRSACDMSRLQADERIAHLALNLRAGVSAATESTTTTSTAPERTSASVISNACSPVSGWETSMESISTPIRAA